MSTAGRVPKPPFVEGTSEPTPTDVFRIVWWSQVGFWHRVRHAPAGRGAALVLALLWWPTWPVHVLLRSALMAQPSTRYYVSAGRDAMLAVTADGEGWTVTEHVSRRPGSGQGAALRASLAPCLIAIATEQALPIRAATASTSLAARYVTELEALGLVVELLPGGVLTARTATGTSAQTLDDVPAPLDPEPGD